MTFLSRFLSFDLAMRRFRPGHLIIALVAACGISACGSPERAVTAEALSSRTTPSGDVVGFIGRYEAHNWVGIPYAAAPVDDLRWRAPRPHDGWERQLVALDPGAPCPQYGSALGGVGEPGKPAGDEDCLRLNVYAPQMSLEDASASKLPVMMWIHGGGNSIGTKDFYDGGKLAVSQNVIVVSINYRLGPLGWFLHPALNDGANGPTLDGSGNYGALDTIAALRWIRAHISAFGGDPGNVTVFGESAGGTNTLALLISPEARGLFHRAIAQSGGLGFSSPEFAQDFAPSTSGPTGAGHAFSSNEVLLRLMIKSGKSPDRSAAATTLATWTPAQTSAFLRGHDTWEFFAAYADGPRGLMGPNAPKVFQDGLVLAQGEPVELLAQTNVGPDSVPLLLGTNRDEPKIFMAFDRDRVSTAFGIPYSLQDPKSYQRDAHLGALAWKYRGVDNIATRLTLSGATAVYAYRWDWDEQGSVLGLIDLSQIVGAAHGLEIPFVFGHFAVGPQTGLLYHDDNADGRTALSNAMMSYWAHFARHGAPGNGGQSHLPEWSSWNNTPDENTMMVLDTAPAGPRMSAERVSLGSLLHAHESADFDSEEERCLALHQTFARDRSSAATSFFQSITARCAGMEPPVASTEEN